MSQLGHDLSRTIKATLVAIAIQGCGAAGHGGLPNSRLADIRSAAGTISAAGIRRDIEYMASDELGGRDTFSPGLDSAAQFIARRLESAGLRPLGDDASFFQRYVVREVVVDTAGTVLIANGQRFVFGDVAIIGCERAINADAAVVHVGHGYRIPSLNIDAYRGLDVRGKLVLVTAGTPEGLAPDALPQDAEPPQIAAQNLGALAVLLLSPSPAVFRSVRTGGGWRTRDVLLSPASQNRPVATRLMLAPHVARALFEGDTAQMNVLLAGRMAPSFELSAKATLVVPVRSQEYVRYNVVASIPGAAPALQDQFVMLGAHLDGVTGPSLNGDSIYNAADDNASGSAAILAIAEAMMRAPRPKRSVGFLWSTGHEIGLWGTRAFASAGAVRVKNIVAHFNVDMVSSTRAPGRADSMSVDASGPDEVNVIGPRAISSELDSLVESVNAGFLRMRLNHRHDNPESPFIYPRTDARPLVEHGVPTVEFMTGFHPRYHQPSDESAYIDADKAAAVSQTVMVIAWTLADAPRLPRMDKGYPPRVPRVP